MGNTAPALHLVRHGEVENPHHLVYGTLDGFPLSVVGRRQASAAARRLATADVIAVVSSPLERAMETAKTIAEPHAVGVAADPRLTEWALGDRWAGHRWEDLPARFPGELERYLARPTGLAFLDETLETLATRVVAAVDDAWRRRAGSGDVVVVGHQDPLETARRRLTDRPLTRFHTGKPGHATVITLTGDGERWQETAVWSPEPDAW